MREEKRLSLIYLWDKRTLYLTDRLGELTANTASAVLVIGMEQPFEFWTVAEGEEKRINTRVMLIPAGKVIHVNHFDLPVAYCYLDPINQDYRYLQGFMKHEFDNVYYDSAKLADWIEIIDSIHVNVLSNEEAHTCMARGILSVPALPTIKARHMLAVEQAIAIINAAPMENPSNQSLSEKVGLSEILLQRQFKLITGIPIRRYRLWRRLNVTATLLGFGLSLTEASHEAGFSDSSHFNHTYRSIIGLTPSFVLKRKKGTRIFVSEMQESRLRKLR